MSVEDWLSELDLSLKIYASFFSDLGFTSIKMLFLKLKALKKNASHNACTAQAYHFKHSLKNANS